MHLVHTADYLLSHEAAISRWKGHEKLLSQEPISISTSMEPMMSKCCTDSVKNETGDDEKIPRCLLQA